MPIIYKKNVLKSISKIYRKPKTLAGNLGGEPITTSTTNSPALPASSGECCKTEYDFAMKYNTTANRNTYWQCYNTNCI